MRKKRISKCLLKRAVLVRVVLMRVVLVRAVLERSRFRAIADVRAGGARRLPC